MQGMLGLVHRPFPPPVFCSLQTQRGKSDHVWIDRRVETRGGLRHGRSLVVSWIDRR